MTIRPTPDRVPDGFTSNFYDPFSVPIVEPDDLDLVSVMALDDPRAVLTAEELVKMSMAALELLKKMTGLIRGSDGRVYGNIDGARYVLNSYGQPEWLIWMPLPAVLTPAVSAPVPVVPSSASSSTTLTTTGPNAATVLANAFVKSTTGPKVPTPTATAVAGSGHMIGGVSGVSGVFPGGLASGGSIQPSIFIPTTWLSVPAAAPTPPWKPTSQINFRSDPELKYALKVAAAKAKLSMGEFLTKIATERLDELQMDEDIATGSETFTFELGATKTPAAEDHQATMELLRSMLNAKGYKVGKTLVSSVENSTPVAFGPAPPGTFSASRPMPLPVIAGAGLTLSGNVISVAPPTNITCYSCNSTKMGMHLQGCPVAPCLDCGATGYHHSQCQSAPCSSCQTKNGNHQTWCSNYAPF